jgi:hypothetical protein
MAKKDRIPVPDSVATLLMFRSDRTCCVCRQRGEPMQIHHIDEDPSNNDLDNLAILCFHCHDETQIRGGFGRKLDAAQVTYYRDDWHRRVEARREAADKIALAREAGDVQTTVPTATRRDALPDHAAKLTNYIRTLPAIRRDAYSRARRLWDSGGRQNMKQGTLNVIDVVEQVLIALASWYPPHHFDGKEPWDYINEMKASRFEWHWAHRHPLGFKGWGGSVIMIETAGSVLDDLETMVVDMVFGLSQHLVLNSELWKQEWDSACEASSIGERSAESGLGGVVQSEDYAKRILGRWLGRRKYIAFYADGRWGVQRNEDAPIEIDGRRWQIDGDKLLLTFRGDADVITSQSTITSFMSKQFITETNGHTETYDWAP